MGKHSIEPLGQCRVVRRKKINSEPVWLRCLGLRKLKLNQRLALTNIGNTNKKLKDNFENYSNHRPQNCTNVN